MVIVTSHRPSTLFLQFLPDHRSRCRFRHTTNFHLLQSSSVTPQQCLRSIFPSEECRRSLLCPWGSVSFHSQISILIVLFFFSDCGGFFLSFSFLFYFCLPYLYFSGLISFFSLLSSFIVSIRTFQIYLFHEAPVHISTS